MSCNYSRPACRFDKNAVNDIDLKKQYTLHVTKDIADKTKLAGMVASGICHPCGRSVWKDALVALRDANPGHYFGPIF